MARPKNQSCGNCLYREPDGETELCLRYPPQLCEDSDSYGASFYPEIAPTSWCGEWKADELAEARTEVLTLGGGLRLTLRVEKEVG